MSSILTDTADAVTTALNAAPFMSGTTAVRSFADWDEKLEGDLDAIVVDVVPRFDPETELVDRGQLNYTFGVDVAVRKKLGTSDYESDGRVKTDSVDALVERVEQIAEFFCEDRFADSPFAVWTETRIRAAYSRRHLQQHRMFLGFVTLTFQAGKDL